MSVTVIVPVYNAALETDACLKRLARFLPAGWAVHIIDDASPDAGVASVLQAHQRLNPRWCWQRNETNRGFVASCNLAAFRVNPDHHVLLLNTDTLPTQGCFSRILQALESDDTVATVTPWSNNAEICSLPDFCVAAAVPAHLDRLAACIDGHQPVYPELPTAVGFCMLIRRQVLNELGLFDAETFGRGYGEENDFCMRVQKAGYKNILCDNAYVAHLGGRSFTPLGLKPGPESMQRLLSKHPNYQELVAAFIARDPLQPVREAIIKRVPPHYWAANQVTR